MTHADELREIATSAEFLQDNLSLFEEHEAEKVLGPGGLERLNRLLDDLQADCEELAEELK